MNKKRKVRKKRKNRASKNTFSKKANLKLRKKSNNLRIKPKTLGRYFAYYLPKGWRVFYCLKKRIKDKTKKLTSEFSDYPGPTAVLLCQKKKRNKKKEKSLILPLYFGWGLKIALVKLPSNTHNLTSKIFKKWWQEAVALILILTVVASSFFWYHPQPALGATYTWFQTDWSGGATTTAAVHPANQTGWTRYYSASSTLSIGTELTLSATASSTTQTSDTDFNAGTFSQTTLTGTGFGAKIIIWTYALDRRQLTLWYYQIASTFSYLLLRQGDVLLTRLRVKRGALTRTIGSLGDN